MGPIVFLIWLGFNTQQLIAKSSIYQKQIKSLYNQNIEFLENESAHLRPLRDTSNLFRIGAIVDPLDYGTEQALKSGIQVANLLMHKVDQLSDQSIKAEVVWIPNEEFYSASTNVCQLLEKGVVAFISPPNPVLRQSVKMVSNQFKIPLIETFWNIDKSNTKYSINIHPDHDSFGRAIFEYIASHEKCNRIALILMNYEGISKYTTFLNNFEGTLTIQTWGTNTSNWKEIVAGLATNSEQNILLDIPYWMAKEFLVLAYVHNMTGGSYHYVFTDWDIHLLDLSSFKINGGARITTFSIVPQITEYERYGRGTIVEMLRSKINKIERAQRSSNILPFITASASLIYDAVLLFGNALMSEAQYTTPGDSQLNCKLIEKHLPFGEALVNASKSLASDSLPVITGNIHFDKSGFRSNFNMTVLSLQNRGFKEIGFWSDQTGLRITKKFEDKPKVIKKPMTTKVLRVTTLPDVPFVIPKKFDAYGQPLKSPDAWTGYCLDLLTLIADDVGFNFTFQVAKDKHYGSLFITEDGKEYYDGMVGEVLRGEADMAVAGLTINYDRERVLDFSTPFMNIGGSLLSTRPKSQKPSIFSFLQPLSPTVWAYVVTTYIIVSFGLFIVARLSPYEWQNPHPCESFSDEKENQFTILSSFWFFMSPLLNQGTEMAPHTISTRLLTGVWWFFALIIISTYTANLAAFLTVDTTYMEIESVEDLVAQTKIKYGTLSSGSSHDFFKSSRIPVFRKMWEYMSKNKDVFVMNTTEGIAKVLAGDYVFILESSWNEYYNQRNCNLMQVGRLLDSKGYGIGLPQGSPYRDAISESILKLQKSQILDGLRRKWWMEFNISEPCINAKDSSKEASPLDIEQVAGVFVVLIIGFLGAFIVSMIEFCVHNKACIKTCKTMSIEMWKELKFAMRCMTPSTRSKEDEEEETNKCLQISMNNFHESFIPSHVSSINSSIAATSSLSAKTVNHSVNLLQPVTQLANVPPSPHLLLPNIAHESDISCHQLDTSDGSAFSSDSFRHDLGDVEINFDSYQSEDPWWTRNAQRILPNQSRRFEKA